VFEIKPAIKEAGENGSYFRFSRAVLGILLFCVLYQAAGIGWCSYQITSARVFEMKGDRFRAASGYLLCLRFGVFGILGKIPGNVAQWSLPGWNPYEEEARRRLAVLAEGT